VNATRAELIKLVTLPALSLTVVLTWAVTAALVLALDAGPESIRYARAGFVVLGALAAASEYDDGQLRTSLVCSPRRLELLAVKALVLGLAATAVAVVTVLIAGAGDVLIAGAGDVLIAGAGDILIAGAGDVAELVLTVLLAAAVATVLRGAVPAVAVILGYYYVLGPFVEDWLVDGPWLPAAAFLIAAATFVRRDA